MIASILFIFSAGFIIGTLYVRKKHIQQLIDGLESLVVEMSGNKKNKQEEEDVFDGERLDINEISDEWEEIEVTANTDMPDPKKNSN